MTKDKKIIIEGKTKEGKDFRPSNWAERMSGKLSTVHKQRVRYSPLLKPIKQNGTQCVAVDPKLKDTNPELFDSLMQFAKTHNLPICQDLDIDTATEESHDNDQ